MFKHIYQEGVAEYLAGGNLSCNPYMQGTDEWKSWDRGFKESWTSDMAED